MCTATLKQELDQRVQLLPDSSVRLLIEFLDSLQDEMQAGAPHNQSTTQAGSVNGQTVSSTGLFGSMRDRIHYIADDFDETPECFKEYA